MHSRFQSSPGPHNFAGSAVPINPAPLDREALREGGIGIITPPVTRLANEGMAIAAWIEGRTGPLLFDTIYSALGTRVRSELAMGLGAEVDEDGTLLVNRHQRTSIPGLYAAGDVVEGLSQISIAAAHAAIAATDINNRLPPLRY